MCVGATVKLRNVVVTVLEEGGCFGGTVGWVGVCIVVRVDRGEDVIGNGGRLWVGIIGPSH